jgi:MFS family permease
VIKLAAFLSGAALLILELMGVRLLTPAFGSSMIVYSAVIAVFLAAMALGYFIGGYIGDRAPYRSTLALALGVGAVLLAGCTPVAPPVAESFAAARFGGYWAPVLAAFAVFTLPSAVLAFAPPIAIRLEMKDVAHSGSVSGRIYAISTFGSIVGTLSVPFLITLMPVSVGLYCVAGALIVYAGLLLALPGAKAV